MSYRGFHNLYDAYGSVTLTETSPPQSFVEPFTVAEIRSYLRIPDIPAFADDENLLITSFISAARAEAEVEQGRDLVQKQLDLTFDFWPGRKLVLGAPLVSVDLVAYQNSDGTTTDLTANVDYRVDLSKDPGIVEPVYGTWWPSFTPEPSSSILVRFTSGYAPNDPFWSDLGARLKAFMRMQISEWYNNRLPSDLPKGQPEISSYLSYGGRRRVY